MITRKNFLIRSAGAAIALALAACAPSAETTEALDADAVHRSVLVLDSHVDFLIPSTPARYAAPDGSSYASLERLTQGGVGAIVFAAAVADGPRTPEAIAAARAEIEEKITAIRAFATDNPERAALALSAGDVERLHSEGKIAVIIGFQNARSLGRDVGQLDALYNEGVRVFAFNHAGNNYFADSSRPAREPYAENGGLSDLGRQGVARLNDLGALIDVSQLSTDALLQTVELSRAPVVATHSSVRALVNNERNLSDAEIDAIAAKGGVVQITLLSGYLRNPSTEQLARVTALRQQYGLPAEAPAAGIYSDIASLPDAQRENFINALVALPAEPATVSDFVDHIEYVIRRVGIEHVGVGTDFNHGAGIDGYATEADAANVTRELVRRGYTQEQIAAIWGGNFLRAWRAAEAAREPA